MKNDMTQLKGLVADLMERNSSISLSDENEAYVKRLANEDSTISNYEEIERPREGTSYPYEIVTQDNLPSDQFEEHEVVEESLSLVDHEKELIIKALKKHGNRRKKAAEELGISERTLYRKIKEYDIG